MGLGVWNLPGLLSPSPAPIAPHPPTPCLYTHILSLSKKQNETKNPPKLRLYTPHSYIEEEIYYIMHITMYRGL